MFDSFPSNINFNISFLIVLIVSIIAGITSYYLYRRTIPPLSKKWRVFLGINRGIIIAAIMLLLLAPELTFVWDKKIKKKVAVAIDKSASMALSDKNVVRINKANSIVQNIVKEIQDISDLSVYEFDANTRKTVTSIIETSDLATDINGALIQIYKEEKNPESIVLISDGNFTAGDNPLFSSLLKKTKIYSIGIGDTIEIPDLIISDVKTNKIVYKNKPTIIQTEILASGIKKQSLSLTLKQDAKVVAVKTVEVESSGSIIPVSFEVTPNKIGLINYKLELEMLPEEQIVENNQYVFNLEVLKDKIKVGLIAAKPNYDVKFMRQILSSIDDLSLKTAIEKKDNQTYFSTVQQVLDSVDVLLLHDFPSSFTSVSVRDHILSTIKRNNTPLFFVTGEAITAIQLSFLQEFFPVVSLRNSADKIKTQINRTVKGEVTSIFEIFDSKEENNKFWKRCPPIQYPFANPIFETEYNVLLVSNNPSGNIEKQLPVLISSQAQGRKSMLLLGSGFWRWHFLFAEDKQFQNGWKTVLYNIIRWLDSGTVNKNVIISTNRKEFQVGETIQLHTQVFDGSFAPVDDGLVQVRISSPAGNFEVESENLGGGIYIGKFIPLTQGKYQIEATAWKNDIKMGNDKSAIAVTPVNNEFLYTQQDKLFLQKLSKNSGGEYFSEDKYSDLFNSLDLNPEIRQERETIELWHHMYTLIFVIFLLCVEWFIRKRKGLA